MITIKTPAGSPIPVPIFEELAHHSLAFTVNESAETQRVSLLEGAEEIFDEAKILDHIRELGMESRIGWYCRC